jgi:hypothetical protein
MAYTNTDYSFWTNPKVRAAGKDAAFLYIAGNGFCNEYLTDGFISDTDIETVAFNAFLRSPKKAVESLMVAGLWDRVRGGYKIHDYLDYNKSKKEIEELRSKKTAAGRKGGRASAQAGAQASAEASAQAKTEQYNYVSISNLKDTTTTVPPSDFQPFAEVYELVTGSEPKVLNAEIEAVSAIIKAGGTPDDFRSALQGMQDKDYTIANMASALTWTLKDIDKRKQPVRPNRVGRKPTSASLDEILDGAPIFAEDK